MQSQGIVVGFLLIMASSSAIDVSSVDQLASALNGDDLTIVLKDIHVPAGQTLNMENLKPRTVVQFTGKITFGYKEWVGPLVRISGTKIKVEGTQGHLIDGGGERWWDGKGGSGGKTKPKFITFRLIASEVSGLNFKNSPVQLASVNECYNVRFSNIRLDNSEGRALGEDTDGFDVDNSANLIISSCRIENQGACLAISSGRNIKLQDNVCIGGRGISIGSVEDRSNTVVENVIVTRCTIINNTHGIRINTVKGYAGKNIAFKNVELRNISKIGIAIQGTSSNSRVARGVPTGGVPIENLAISNVHGTVSPQGANLNIVVANAKNWLWNTNVTGGKRRDVCRGIPPGAKVPCNKNQRDF